MKIGYSATQGEYEVLRLPDGKNPLSGSTNDDFKCVELEVFALK